MSPHIDPLYSKWVRAVAAYQLAQANTLKAPTTEQIQRLIEAREHMRAAAIEAENSPFYHLVKSDIKRIGLTAIATKT